MRPDDEKNPTPDVPPGSDPEGSESGRRRIQVTGGDPWVRGRAVEAGRERQHRPSAWLEDTPREQARRKSLRKQSSLLGLIFAFIAVVVFVATRVMAPSVLVHLEGGEGMVLVDREEAARTGEIFTVSPGQHELIVVPDNPDAIAEPPVIVREFGYAWDPVNLRFTLIERANPPRSEDTYNGEPDIGERP